MLGSIIGGGLSAIGGIAGGLFGSSAEKKALNYQKGQSEKSLLSQQNALLQAQAQMQPYTQAGQYATPLLSYLTTGINPYEWNDDLQSEYDSLKAQEDALRRTYQGVMSSATGSRDTQREHRNTAARISTQLARLAELEGQYAGSNAISNYSMQQNPAYQWQQQKGEDAINRAYAARGMYGSRPAVNSLSDFNQSLAGQEYNNQFNRLATMANYGMGAAANVGNYNINTGQNMGQTAMQTGQMVGQGISNYGQTMGGTIANAFGALGQGISNQGYVNSMNNYANQIQGMNSGGALGGGMLGGGFNSPSYSLMG
jgi:hypothetical protein